MRIWIVTTGEPIPYVDGDNIRLWRSTLLAEMLVSRGHQVTRWAGTFDHSRKINRFHSNFTVEINSLYRINFFYSKGYKKNISFKRLVDHKEGADNFKKWIEREQTPDLVFCSLPTLELCHVAVQYSRKNKLPIVLDIRDLWPDLYTELTPLFFRPLARLLLGKYYGLLKYSCTHATAITGISEKYVQWGVGYSSSCIIEKNSYFPHGYVQANLKNDELKSAEKFWKSFDFIQQNDFLICMFSSMGNVLDIKPIVDAAYRFEKENLPIKFVLCGDGVKINEFRKKVGDCKNILMPGWVGQNEIQYLMRESKLGILPYKDLQNYQLNIPNKPIEYLSAGLPIVTSVSGILKSTIEEYECGEFYFSNIKFDLYNKILGLYLSPMQLNWLSKNASSLYDLKFNASIVYMQMVDYLESVKNNFHEKI